MAVRVTVRNMDTGVEDTTVVRDGDYVVIALAPCEAHMVWERDGGKTRGLEITNRVPQSGNGLWRP